MSEAEETPEEWMRRLREEDRRFQGALMIVVAVIALMVVVAAVLVEVAS